MTASEKPLLFVYKVMGKYRNPEMFWKESIFEKRVLYNWFWIIRGVSNGDIDLALKNLLLIPKIDRVENLTSISWVHMRSLIDPGGNLKDVIWIVHDSAVTYNITS